MCGLPGSNSQTLGKSQALCADQLESSIPACLSQGSPGTFVPVTSR